MGATRLIFVYNAEAGIAAGLRDSLHKLVSPSTYPCSLCAVTYGAVGMRREWREWLARQDFDTVFYHRADFRAAYPELAGEPLPLVAVEQDGETRILLAASMLDKMSDVGQLVVTIEAVLTSDRT